MGGLSWWHWLIIIAAFILIFGAKKLPDAARGVGRSLRILKSEVSAMHEEGSKPATPAETDASASVATPAAQLAPQPPAPTPAAPAAPPAQAASVPVINGVPVTDKQQ
jgi:sec-independent protein translocase protein TatA